MADGRRSPLRPLLLGGALLLVIAGTLLFLTAPEPELVEAAGEAATRRSVVTLRVRPVSVRAATEVSGMLDPRRSVDLFAETRGPVVEIGAEELDRVEAGQLLARLDPLLAEVAVERAEAAVNRTRSELALARSNLARRQSLTGQGVASESALEDAQNAERVAAAALREALAERVRARDDLAKKTIVAPFAGVLRSFRVDVGEYLSEGQQLAELLDVTSARLTIGLADREVVAVRPGQKVAVDVEAYPNETFTGEVLRVGAASDPVDKKFPVEIELANADGRLLPGMVARVTLDLGELPERLIIPREASLDEFGLRFVYVIESNGAGDLVARQRRVQVRPLPFRPADLHVVAGLSEGEEVAVSGIRQLRDGEHVRRAGGVGGGP